VAAAAAAVSLGYMAAAAALDTGFFHIDETSVWVRVYS
jgi:hypothetical protein